MKPKCEESLSSFAFNCNLRHYNKYPWTITKRQFANNIHRLCKAPILITLPLLAAPGRAVQVPTRFTLL